MKKADVKIGMKVVPFRKTVRGWNTSLRRSVEWENAKKQKFLYVVRWDKDGYWVLSARRDHRAGDYFNSGDFRPYKAK